MSDLLHVEALRAGSLFWNTWRRKNSGVVPDLSDLSVSVSERQFGRVQGGPIDLNRANLCRARLDQATLIEANLSRAVLVEADLSDARLEKADLRSANLSNAKLANATLDGAQLELAVVYGADLRHARGLTQAQIDRCLGDRRTTLPTNLGMPTAWLTEGQSAPVHWGVDPAIGDHRANPFTILGVRQGASFEQIRAAWLKLVKELHSDAWSSHEAAAAERLKVINRAYQSLKSHERQASQARTGRGIFGDVRTVFAAFFLLPIIMGALLIYARTYLLRQDIVASPAAGTSIETSEYRQQRKRSETSSTHSGRSSTYEPFVGADWRLR